MKGSKVVLLVGVILFVLMAAWGAYLLATADPHRIGMILLSFGLGFAIVLGFLAYQPRCKKCDRYRSYFDRKACDVCGAKS